MDPHYFSFVTQTGLLNEQWGPQQVGSNGGCFLVRTSSLTDFGGNEFGFRIGSGTQGPPSDKADILVAQPGIVGYETVKSVHCILYRGPETPAWIIKTKKSIVLDDVTIPPDEEIPLSQPRSDLEIGDLKFRIVFCIDTLEREEFDHDIEIESKAGIPLSKYNFEQWPNVDPLDTQIDLLRDRIEGLRVMHFSRWHHLRITPEAIVVYEMDGSLYTALIELNMADKLFTRIRIRDENSSSRRPG